MAAVRLQCGGGDVVVSKSGGVKGGVEDVNCFGIRKRRFQRDSPEDLKSGGGGSEGLEGGMEVSEKVPIRVH